MKPEICEDALYCLDEFVQRTSGRPMFIGDLVTVCIFFFSSRRRHTRLQGDWSSDVCSSDLQERLAGGFLVDDFFPEAADLPEDIQDAELRSRYGGVGGPLFRAYAAEVERRLDRKSGGEGKSVDLGGRRIIKKKKKKTRRTAV